MKSSIQTVQVTTQSYVVPKTYTVKQFTNAPQHGDYIYDIFDKGDKVHVNFYTDVQPATVVDVKRNGKQVTVQIDDYKLADGQKPDIIVGGFAGHCTNQRDLKYDITRNDKGRLMTFTLRKWRGRYCWTIKGSTPNGRQGLAKGWVAFYDYNF